VSPPAKYSCKVCGGPIMLPGIHHRCRPQEEYVTVPKMIRALDKLQHETQKRLLDGVKHWKRSDGRKKLARMFPDMVERVMANEGGGK